MKNRNIIINADDYGCSHTVNEAIVECFKSGYITQTTIMPNMPAFDEAVQLAKDNNFMNKVGLHITLDGGNRPLSDKISNNLKFCNKEGYLLQGINLFAKERFCLSNYDKECLQIEIEAQMKKYIESGFNSMHIDSHHHIHNFYSILKIIIPLAKKNNFKTIRLCRNIYDNDSKFYKQIYKSYINGMMKKYFDTLNYFGSYVDFNNNRDKNNVEIMVHPDIIDGKLVDVLNRNNNQNADIREYLY